MSYQSIIYTGMEYLQQQSQALKDSYVFNSVLLAHYKTRYADARRKWRFATACFCWFKIQHYQRKCYSMELNLKLNLPPVCKN